MADSADLFVAKAVGILGVYPARKVLPDRAHRGLARGALE